MKKVELLYFDGCPSWKAGLRNLEEALALKNIRVDIDLLLIESNDDASKEKFLGSPSFRFDDTDLWPQERETYAIGCRIYLTQEGYKGFPTVMMLREKIREMKALKPQVTGV
ncbi:MAG: hypothetical protein AAGU04_01145 [Anaerolineaceae bacterium]